MLAYSSIAHAGFILVGLIALDRQGLSATLFYLLAYGFTTIGAFAVVTLVRDADGEATHLSQWAGLGRRSPVVAGVFTLFLLALAGIPLTSGFTGKFAVFPAALPGGRAAGRRRADRQRGRGVLLRADHRAHVLLGAGRGRPDDRAALAADDDRAVVGVAATIILGSSRSRSSTSPTALRCSRPADPRLVVPAAAGRSRHPGRRRGRRRRRRRRWSARRPARSPSARSSSPSSRCGGRTSGTAPRRRCRPTRPGSPAAARR